ncbi:heme ABC exporter ATP-binding protein CcmA [Candidatus Anaplasma sp. TIGMIC]|uniref:heme ABC exporter ATP-binding protein CcmA n=1 Tax=Candidatus Anaplasma sp. TIGMIC TaxID=3020713 RepID=UPI00232FB077|nr:heme ABC exporter ATP-binding protein CcmA [Candidatus Anaplasma sp. TIGMIC]MDB1135122.1 heme ABC exporter ATP-binding protein CcmA [Candidatus Anaplasma sp. TIGMIC]
MLVFGSSAWVKLDGGVVLECSNVTCIRGESVLFKNLSFVADYGTVTVVTGMNGSGKTSLLRAMVGLVPIRFGTITLDGEVVTTSSTCISNITYVGHKNACYEHLSTADILRYWAHSRDKDALLSAAVNFFGLDPVLNTKYKHLSSGWKRKVALSRLLLFNTQVWIIDEPFTNMDSQAIDTVRNLIHTRAEHGGIVVMSDHNPAHIFPDAQIVHLSPTRAEEVLT